MLKSLMVAVAMLLFGAWAALAGPLHDAVKDGDLARLQELIEAGEDLAAQDKFVGTALHWAALKDNVDAARILIDAGADVNLPKIGGQETPLHIAAERGSAEVATLLIDAGADIEARTAASAEGAMPLHSAAGTDRVDLVQLLIEAGADIEARNLPGGTPLMAAASANAAGAIELLVAAGADIDAKLPSGRTGLALAAITGGVDAVRKLLELEAEVNGAPETEPVFPSTPLAEALVLGLDEIADILREAGASE
jgi:ankyrin repeat protein